MSRNGRSDKEMFYKNYYPPSKPWDVVMELSPETSEYYAIMVQKFGKAMADYYWNRRYDYEGERDMIWRKECEEIVIKCNEFLISRGIKV